MTTSYYSPNEFPTYSFDNNPSIPNYDYNSTWNENESGMKRQPGSIEFFLLLRAQKILSNRCSSWFLNDVYQPIKKNVVVHYQLIPLFLIFVQPIPNVQPDTKLSKIKTLKLATKYIEFLMDILAKDDPTAMPSAFKADMQVKTRKDCREI